METVRRIDPEHVDARGSIARILDGEAKIRSILLITAKAGAVRANHYHKKDSHYVYMLSGEMAYTDRPVRGAGRGKKTVVLRKGDMVYSPPMVAHAMRFLKDSVFLAFTAKARDQGSYEADTVRVTLIEPS